MKRITVTLFLLGISATGWACTLCNKQVMDGIYNGQFYPNLFTLLSTFLVLAFIVLGLHTFWNGTTDKGCDFVHSTRDINALPIHKSLISTFSYFLGLHHGFLLILVHIGIQHVGLYKKGSFCWTRTNASNRDIAIHIFKFRGHSFRQGYHKRFRGMVH